MSTVRTVTFNTLFGGNADFGFGPEERWDGQMEFLRSLRPDILAVQECNGWEQLGRRRLHRAVNALGLARGLLAEANPTTAGHRFHSAILLSERIRVDAEGADRTRYHHVMGWAHRSCRASTGYWRCATCTWTPSTRATGPARSPRWKFSPRPTDCRYCWETSTRSASAFRSRTGPGCRRTC